MHHLVVKKVLLNIFIVAPWLCLLLLLNIITYFKSIAFPKETEKCDCDLRHLSVFCNRTQACTFLSFSFCRKTSRPYCRHTRDRWLSALHAVCKLLQIFRKGKMTHCEKCLVSYTLPNLFLLNHCPRLSLNSLEHCVISECRDLE